MVQPPKLSNIDIKISDVNLVLKGESGSAVIERLPKIPNTIISIDKTTKIKNGDTLNIKITGDAGYEVNHKAFIEFTYNVSGLTEPTQSVKPTQPVASDDFGYLKYIFGDVEAMPRGQNIATFRDILDIDKNKNLKYNKLSKSEIDEALKKYGKADVGLIEDLFKKGIDKISRGKNIATDEDIMRIFKNSGGKI